MVPVPSVCFLDQEKEYEMSIETKVLEILLNESHFYLMVGIFSFLIILKSIKPVRDFLFSDRWKWIVPILNVGISFCGVFLFGMTNVTTNGMKIVIALLISAVVILAYEGIFKMMSNLITSKLLKK